ncbi:hypothetical protein ACFOWX_04425 [Sphingorhabdus arenilitoris]|uniref:Secreted protein n=1 Tax=Sphingorhabdus arenilitoris TaxID=1490041 RepID=A0ABV8RE72_9SPHN
MRFGKNSLAAVAAATLVLAPTIAQAAPAAKAASNQVERASASPQDESKLEGSTGIILAILAAAGIIAGIVIAAGNNEDTPTSPG